MKKIFFLTVCVSFLFISGCTSWKPDFVEKGTLGGTMGPKQVSVETGYPLCEHRFNSGTDSYVFWVFDRGEVIDPFVIYYPACSFQKVMSALYAHETPPHFEPRGYVSKIIGHDEDGLVWTEFYVNGKIHFVGFINAGWDENRGPVPLGHSQVWFNPLSNPIGY